jgi:hypothetical protein
MPRAMQDIMRQERDTNRPWQTEPLWVWLCHDFVYWYGPILTASYLSLLGLRYAYDWLIANGPAWLVTVLGWM